MTKLPAITLPIAEALIATVISRYGEDFKYSDQPIGFCYYVPLGDVVFPDEERADWNSEHVPEDSPKRQTGCLIGTALEQYGVPHSLLAHMFEDIEVESGQNLLGVVDFTPDALMYLSDLQSRQDQGDTWGEANFESLKAIEEGDELR